MAMMALVTHTTSKHQPAFIGVVCSLPRAGQNCIYFHSIYTYIYILPFITITPFSLPIRLIPGKGFEHNIGRPPTGICLSHHKQHKQQISINSIFLSPSGHRSHSQHCHTCCPFLGQQWEQGDCASQQFYPQSIHITMGNQQCHDCQPAKLENHAYGDYELMHQAAQLYAVVEKKVEKDPRLEAKVIRQLEERKTITNPHVVKLHNYSIDHEEYGFKVTMHYEYVPKTLRHRIDEMRSKDCPFSQRECFAIIYGVETALQELQAREIKHCCINLDTIVCRNNFYKLTDVSSTTYITSYDLAKKGNREQFLNEKLLESLAHESLDPIYDIRDDYFSLGMIVLMMVSGKEVRDFYCWESKKPNVISLNSKQVEVSMKELERNYSSKLAKKVRQLLCEGESEKEEFSNLTDTLEELDEEMNRVLNKCRQHTSSLSTYPQSNSTSFRQN